MSLEALKKQVSAAQADAIQQKQNSYHIAERLRKQFPENCKEKLGTHLDKFLETIGYLHVNDLLGQDIDKKPFSISTVAIRLNSPNKIDMEYVKALIKLYDKLLKAIDDCDGDERKQVINHIQMCMRGLLD